MARSCGIHIDQRHFHIVALDGSAKKHKVLARASGTIEAGEDAVESVAHALREFSKTHKLNPESIGLAVDSGLAAFRRLSVPFDDREKTEDIIKFEIESDLPQWDIDEVIVDFHVISSTPGVESNLLVTALPKDRLERQLAACERGSMEADEAELDGSALFNAAVATEITSDDSAQALVYVGDATTTVVIVDKNKLVSMRAIRAGALPPGQFLFTKDESEEDADDESAAPETADAEASAELQAAPAGHAAGTVARIRREIARTLEAAQTEFEIEAIYMAGNELDGLGAEPIHEIPFRPLEVFPEGESSREERALQTVAFGSALRALGGGQLSPHLRREELRYTGTFERLELPLAVLGLLLCTLLGVMSIVLHKRIGWRDAGTLEEPGDMQFWAQNGVTALLGDATEGIPARLKNPPKEIKDYADEVAAGAGGTIPTFNKIRRINQLMSTEIKDLRRTVGEITDEVPPQSALQGGLLVLVTLKDLGKDLGQFSIRKFESKYERGSGKRKKDHVMVTLDMDFFAVSEAAASRNFDKFRNEIKSNAWCDEFDDKKSDPFDQNGGGLAYRGLVIKIDVAKYLADDLAERLAAEEEASS